MDLVSDTLEIEHVKNVYNIIAKDFSDTRYRPWSCVEKFLDSVKPNSLISDIGCGNGKNMLYRKYCNFIGCDFSCELVKLCLEKNLNVIEGDILNIPFNSALFDYTICIAVIHHLSTIEKRIKAIEELLRITKKGGQILIMVWALKQPKDGKRRFENQDNFVDFKDKHKNVLGSRYYHVFEDNELKELIPKNIKIIKYFYELGNYGIILEK